MKKRICVLVLVLCILILQCSSIMALASSNNVNSMTLEEKKMYLLEIGTPEYVLNQYCEFEIDTLVERMFGKNVEYQETIAPYSASNLQISTYLESKSSSNPLLNKVYVSITYQTYSNIFNLSMYDYCAANWNQNIFQYNSGSFVAGNKNYDMVTVYSKNNLSATAQGGIGWEINVLGSTPYDKWGFAIFELVPNTYDLYATSASGHTIMISQTIACEYASTQLPFTLSFQYGGAGIQISDSIFANKDATAKTIFMYK